MEDLLRVFQALSNRRRLKIVVSLLDSGKATAGSIAARHRIHQTTASRHLRKLEAAGLVRGVQQKQCVYYSAQTHGASIAIRSILMVIHQSPKRRTI